jgi:hypothetical protein
VIEHHSLRPHFYADDVQMNGSAKPSVVSQLQSQLLDCIDDVAGCMRCSRLQRNTAKTEIMWCSTSRRQHQLPTTAVRVGNDFVAPSTSVRDLGIFLDSDVSMKTHVRKTVCTLQLLRHAASASQCAAVCSGGCGYIPAASGIPCFVSVGLWECHPRWPSDPTSTETSVRFERQRSSHFWSQEA